MTRRAPVPEHPLPLFSYLFGGEDLAGKLIVDLFAGGGGVSLGIEMALGRSPDVAINHDVEAVAMHQLNHPSTVHYRSDVFEVDPLEATGGKPVALLWLSPDCKHHSRAKGGRPLDKRIRSLAWVGCKWAGKVRPEVIILENVREFADWGPLVGKRAAAKGPDGKVAWPNKPRSRRRRGAPKQNPPRGPLVFDDEGALHLTADKRPGRKGRIFRAFVKHLRGLGYEVGFTRLRADRYGVPTIRERFFLVARRDGRAITWPEPTHGEGLLPVRTAAECIDWSLPTRTIFEPHEKRPNDLKPKTKTRIAMGIDKFVLGAPRPFLVLCNHGGHDYRQRDPDLPMWTVTSAHDAHGLIMPHLVPMNFDNPPYPATAPAPTVTTQGNRVALIAPYLAPRYGERDGQDPRAVSVESPAPTVTTDGNGGQLAAAHLVKFQQHSVGQEAGEPLDTVMPGATRFGLAAAHMVKFRGDSTGVDVATPAPTITAGGQPVRPGGAAHALGVVSALVVKHYDGFTTPERCGIDARGPVHTVTSSDHHSLVTAHLTTYYGDKGEPDGRGAALGEPVATISTGNRHGLVTATLAQYYGESDAADIAAPLPTVSTRDRFGVVTAHVLRQFGTSDARGFGEPLGAITSAPKDGVITTIGARALDDVTLAGARRVFAFLKEFCPAALDKVDPADRAEQLVTVVIAGEKYVIWDIGMRMLAPRELYRCQGFPESYVIDVTLDGRVLAKDAQTRMCGNSVPPPLVAALVRANFAPAVREAAD